MVSPHEPPNFILLLADDLGYGNLGVTGSKQIPTPHVDSLAADGVRCSSAYVASAACVLHKLGQLELNLPHPLFREPAHWLTRHLTFYDREYQLVQPE